MTQTSPKPACRSGGEWQRRPPGASRHQHDTGRSRSSGKCGGFAYTAAKNLIRLRKSVFCFTVACLTASCTEEFNIIKDYKLVPIGWGDLSLIGGAGSIYVGALEMYELKGDNIYFVSSELGSDEPRDFSKGKWKCQYGVIDTKNDIMIIAKKHDPIFNTIMSDIKSEKMEILDDDCDIESDMK